MLNFMILFSVVSNAFDQTVKYYQYYLLVSLKHVVFSFDKLYVLKI